LVPTTPLTGFDLESTLTSLKCTQSKNPSQFLTPHFGVLSDARRIVDNNVQTLIEWKHVIESLIAVGRLVDKATDMMTRRVSEFAGPPASTVPERIRAHVRLNMLRIRRYLKRNTKLLE